MKPWLENPVYFKINGMFLNDLWVKEDYKLGIVLN